MEIERAQIQKHIQYDIGGLISHEEAQEAFKAAEQYLEKVRLFMEKEDPQLKLDL